MSKGLQLSRNGGPSPDVATGVGRLPAQLTTFLGREREHVEVAQHLLKARLVTLTGSAGCGKTRLALRVAARVRSEFAHGIWFVDLAPLKDPGMVPSAVAAALALHEQQGRTLTETLVGAMRDRSLLLLLDNCEHVLEACGQLVPQLLTRCDRVRVLATSRQPLNVSGEVSWRVPSLSLPATASSSSVDQSMKSEAVRLFVDRGQASDPTFKLTQQNAATVTRICQRLDGIPLAIELAAARVRLMPTGLILDRLDDRFRLLKGGGLASPSRQRTLRAAIDWGYELLTAGQRQLFVRLSTFSGGFRLDAAEAVCAGEGVQANDIVELISELVDRSMVTLGETRNGVARYGLLETLREFGRQQLIETRSSAVYQERHARHYRTLAKQAAAGLESSRYHQWLPRIDEDLDNIRAALDLEIDRHPVAALEMASDLFGYWHARGLFTEAGLRLTAALQANPMTTALRARALGHLGDIEVHLNDLGSAETHLGECLALARRLHDQRDEGMALHLLAGVAEVRGDFVRIRSLLEEGLAVSRSCGDMRTVARGLSELAITLLDDGNAEGSRALAEESLTIARVLGDDDRLAATLLLLARIALISEDMPKAHALAGEALSLSRGVNEKMTAVVLECLAVIGLLESQPERALKLAGAATAIRLWIEDRPNQTWMSRWDGDFQKARAALGREASLASWDAGLALSRDEAVAFALGETDVQAAILERTDSKGKVSRRELEIAALIARGLTNRQMARTLVISERTIESHVDHILNKLSFRSRAQIAAWVVEQRLTASPS